MKYDLVIDPPLMNAAGTLGYSPDPYGVIDLARLGAFITNPVSLKPRAPAQAERYRAYPGGFLLHTGYPNPGLRAVMREHAERWARSPKPVVVHLLCQGVRDAVEMVRRLEGQSGVVGFEIGLPPQIMPMAASELVRAVQGELPLIVRLPFEQALELGPLVNIIAPGVTFSLGPPRGALLAEKAAIHGDSRIVHGRLYGPSLFPQSLEVLRGLVKEGLQVIAGCGVYNSEQVEMLLAVGAVGVQLDVVLWRGGFFSNSR